MNENREVGSACLGTVMTIPELQIIIDRLRGRLECYEIILNDTAIKLKEIKKYVGIPCGVLKVVSEKPSESAIEELYKLVERFGELNERAERNLKHLGEII